MAVTCPLCQSPDVEQVTDVPNLTVCKCRKCATAFVIAAKGPAPS